MDKYIGLDLGTTTLGVAKSDSLGFVHGVDTIRFDKNQYVVARKKVHELVEELDIKNIVLGYPLHLSGNESQMSEICLRFKDDLLKEDPTLNIEMQDERLSTMTAHNILSEKNVNHQQRKSNVDKISACIILETFLRKKGIY